MFVRRLVDQLEKEMAIDRKLLARAQKSGDESEAAALEGKIEGLLAKEGSTQQEQAALREEIKELKEEEREENLKISADEKALVAKRNEALVALYIL